MKRRTSASSTVRQIMLYLIVLILPLACGLPGRSIEIPLGPTLDELATIPAATETPDATDTPAPTETPDFQCPNAPPALLKVGAVGRVTETGGPSLRIRRSPEVAGDNTLKLVPDGTEFKVIGGPVCGSIPDTENSFLFWEVELVSDGSAGWIAEGELTDTGAFSYFIELVP